ncbi:carbohydrate kinase family protein [Streptomyces acidiscabies]|uniref:Sugar kinase n=1 Tax=Streptomyces acidiscabies TaxID=42234 RepID=A0A0L0KJR5_9ACTN|nr:carbohydrate kinase [Streptomyces acidiscabies]KND38502.1 sugar kinase [Streptomyces acidiscabies]
MIVVTGEALIDLVPLGEGALAELQPALGGGPYNTAVALGRLGSPTAFLSRTSTDPFGDALLEGLRSSGVDVSHVQRGPEPTTLAAATLDEDGAAAYSFYVDGTADRLFTAPAELPPGTEAVAFGTCSLVLEPGASAYERLMRGASAKGLFTLLDPNIRPGLISDPDAYRARFRGWLPHVTLLKLSEDDMRWLAVTPLDLLASGPSAVVVTHGSAGLSLFLPGGKVYPVPGDEVAVVDTIGAGDTVNAALLHGLSEMGVLSAAAMGGLSYEAWHRLLSFAARAAALTCSRAGAEPPYASELEDF